MSRWDDAEAEFYGRVIPAFLDGGLAPDNERPAEPPVRESAWYRGWECGYEPDRGFWTPEGYAAYKGGVDLDVPQVHAKTWDELLEAIDDEEDDA